MKGVPHFFDHLSPQQKIDLFEVFEHWPDLLSYFEANHKQKERAFADGNEEELQRLHDKEREQVRRIFEEIIPLMEKWG